MPSSIRESVFRVEKDFAYFEKRRKQELAGD